MLRVKRADADKHLAFVKDWVEEQTGQKPWESVFGNLNNRIWYSDFEDDQKRYRVGFIITVRHIGLFVQIQLQVSLNDTLGAFTSIEVNIDGIKKKNDYKWRCYAHEVFSSLKYLARCQVEQAERIESAKALTA